jgi:hypothetical protein
MFMRKVILFSAFILGMMCSCGNKPANVSTSADSTAVDSIEVVDTLSVDTLTLDTLSE